MTPTDDIKHERELREQWQVAHEQLDLQLHQSSDAALNKASIDIDRRLSEMNEFREQIAAERGEFMRRDMYDREHGNLVDRVADLEISRGESQGKAAAYASIAAFVGIAAGIVMHFLK